MNIAQVTTALPPDPGSTGTVVWHTSRALAARGHDVTVFTARVTTPAESSDRGGDEPFSIERLRAGFRPGHAAAVTGLPGRLREFDVVHLHYPFIGGAGAVDAGARRRAYPLVLTYHGRPRAHGGIRQSLFQAYERIIKPRVLKGATVLVAVDEECRRTDLRAWADVRVLPNGVDPTLFAPRDRQRARRALGIRTWDRVALVVGVPDAHYRFNQMDGLVRGLAKLDPASKFLVTGGGAPSGSLPSLVRRAGLEGRVIFLGQKAPEALSAIYSAADVTVVPSSDTESAELVLLESLACGTPVLAPARPGLVALVGDGGWLVPPGVDGALQDGLQAVFALPRAELRSMGMLAGQRIRQQLTWEKVAAQTEALYQEAMARTADSKVDTPPSGPLPQGL